MKSGNCSSGLSKPDKNKKQDTGKNENLIPTSFQSDKQLKVLETLRLIKNNQLNVSETLSQTRDNSYQNAAYIKTAALEKLSGVKTSGKTHYSVLKESIAKLEMESIRLKKAIQSLEMMSNNLLMLHKGVEPLIQALGKSLLEVSDAQYIIMMVNHERLISIHVPEPCKEQKILETHFSSWFNKTDREDFLSFLGTHYQNLKDEATLSFLPERYGLTELVAFPMRASGKTVGLILLFFDKRYKHDNACQSILQILGNQAAIALENAKLFEDTLFLKQEAEKHYEAECLQKEHLEQKNRELKNIYDMLSRVREEQTLYRERNRIAADLHDNVLQILFAIGLHFDWCYNQLSPGCSVYNKLQVLDSMVDKASQEIRKVIYEFSSMKTNHTLSKSIIELVQDLNQVGSAQITIDITGIEPTLPMELHNIVYCITQEALVNALKHASATKIDIILIFKKKQLELSIIDNGIGISDNNLNDLYQENKKFGLKNMMQRANYLNGILEIKRVNDWGTKVSVLIPLKGDD
ncbi:GAF domain-containing sensor histidine kinase [Candidatus Contubernalis alkaliaceticus]|uniref:GAF domain-containing sensor histidine kinase n=1 Tax=Candidatus Contubernalis alkaliaceticus TaxID=338645 RepID=UPI001F4BE733|nr:GAF domain-containing sensor histidine kinase [Candidatus Contubernalis alkalaceticus]UNC93402.1 sensor histidine kinase [Candidatus Contubernalis alkalaceticus]